MLERYNSMLGAIKDLDSSTHIAGGAVRDTLLERPIRDVDMFLERGRDQRRGQPAAVAVRLRQSRRMGDLRDVLRPRSVAGGQVREGRRNHPGLPDRP